MTGESPRVIVVSEDAQVIQGVSRALENEPTLRVIDPVESLTDLSATLNRQGAALVIIDTGENPIPALARLRGFVDDHARSRFIIIAPDFDKDHLLLAMQAGARHFMPRSWINEDMCPLCRELMDQVATPDAGHHQAGQLFTVIPTAGGCGSTTVAINAAVEAAMRAGTKSLVVDLDVRYGGVAAHLGLSGQYGIADILSRGEQLDAGVIGSTAIHHGERLDILLSPASINFHEPAALEGEHFTQAVEVFRSAYAHTFVDAPSLVPEAQAELARLSTMVLLVVEPTVKALWTARATLTSLARRDVETPITIIVNRTGVKGGLTVADVRATLETDAAIAELPLDIAAQKALNAGATINAAAPKSKLRKSFAKLAEAITIRDDERHGPEKAAA